MKEIKGYENYKITEDGQVWSNNINRYLKPVKDKDGYYKVTLSKIANKNSFSFFVQLQKLIQKTLIIKRPQTIQMGIFIIIIIQIYSGLLIVNRMKILIGKKEKQN